MPLPLIPLLLGGAALIGAGVGVKKGLDAKEDFDRAERITKEAQGLFDKEKLKLETVRDDTQHALETLGSTKIELYEEGLIPFVNTFEKIKNIDFADPNLNVDPELIMNHAELHEIRDITLKIADILSSGAASLAGGALAGFGAFGGAGLLATASTGTAISALSGVAATNATLAWFGGGALAAGGLGMAGGMAVLGGVVAAPVLLVGGFLMASKAESAVYDAYSNLDKAKVACEGMKTARTAARSILRRTEEIIDVLQELESPFIRAVENLQDLVSDNVDFATYTTRERKLVSISCAFASTVKNIMETPIFDEDGVVTKASKAMLTTTRQTLGKIASM